MSESVSYFSEPPTSGKLVLHTTIGDLDIELFAQQAPQTCTTFLHLALRHAYDGCTFHRIESDFLAQTGDLATSSLAPARLHQLRTADWYTTPLKSELHSRLRFNRRGLVGLARPAKPAAAAGQAVVGGGVEDNAQFFITLAPAAELTGAHTLFGKLTGETLYNLARLNERDVAGGGVVVRVVGVEVLVCPVVGLVEEVEAEERRWKEAEEEERRRKKREDGNHKLAKRNVNALSFAADDEEMEAEKPQAGRARKGKSLIDVLVRDDEYVANETKEQASEQRESKQPTSIAPLAVNRGRVDAAFSSGEDDEDHDSRYDTHMREQVLREKLVSADNNGQAAAAPTSSTSVKQQIQSLTKQLFPSKPAVAADSSPAVPAVSLLEQRKHRFMQQKRQRPDDNTSVSDTMAKLARFRNKLSQHALPPPTPNTQPASPLTAESIQPASDWVTAGASLLRDADDDVEVELRARERAEGAAWMRHRLQFEKRPQDFDDGESGGDDGLVVFDPTGKEGSKEDVRMGSKGLGVEMVGQRREGGGERERRRETRIPRSEDSRSRDNRDRRR